MSYILVCVKLVPSSVQVRFDANFCLQRNSSEMTWNIADEAALEAALRLRGADESVVVLTMGIAKAEAALKELLARGADRAILLSDRLLAGSDTHATAAALSAAIKKLGTPRLILCGRRSLDGETGQLPGELAAALGIPCISNIESIDSEDGGRFLLRRRLENCTETLAADRSLVASVCEYSYSLRLPDIASMRRADEQAVEKLSAADIGLSDGDCGLAASLTRTVNMEIRFPALRGGKKDADTIESARKLLAEVTEARK